VLLSTSAVHLTYCTNIHPGEHWSDVHRNLDFHVRAVKARVAPEQPFSVGLRLSGVAVRELATPETLDRFEAWLGRHGLYVHTLNGFPFGPFHGRAIKEHVYRPDWTEPERVLYTAQLAECLAALVPHGLTGNISTVPGCFRRRSSPHRRETIAINLATSVAALWRIAEEQGKELALALEPEPHCLFETTTEGAEFIVSHLFSGAGRTRFEHLTGLDSSRAETALRTHVGLCVDLCHAAIEYENPQDCIENLLSDGIRIAKVQVSSGLRLRCPATGSPAELGEFADETYLHQVVAKTAEGLQRFADIDRALEWRASFAKRDEEEWRIHFHVPLFMKDLGPFESTQDFAAEALRTIRETGACTCLEVETYTWGVLPPAFRNLSIVDAIARELEWVVQQWNQ